jgi:predicted CopG family antitoxin
MTKPVTLSEEAFAQLRRERRDNESTSDTVLRLIRDAQGRKNPSKLFQLRLKRVLTRDEHLAQIRAARDLDTKDPWQE